MLGRRIERSVFSSDLISRYDSSYPRGLPFLITAIQRGFERIDDDARPAWPPPATALIAQTDPLLIERDDAEGNAARHQLGEQALAVLDGTEAFADWLGLRYFVHADVQRPVDVHSSLKAMVDSPAWRLVKALDTLVSDDGNTITIDNYPKPSPISAAEKEMIAKVTARRNEESAKKRMGVPHWIDDLSWQAANERLVSQPTVNIERSVGGYTGADGKTVLPHKAVAKIDMRLVPGMKKDDAVAALKAHLAKRGYGDIEVNVSGGYDSTSSKADAPLIAAQMSVLTRADLDPVLWPRNAGSYPGFVFTDPPLSLASGHFGLGHGRGAHAPDEYYLIEVVQSEVARLRRRGNELCRVSVRVGKQLTDRRSLSDVKKKQASRKARFFSSTERVDSRSHR